MKGFWQLAALGLAHEGEGPVIAPVEQALRALSAEQRRAFYSWATEVDQSLRTRAHHEVAALCFGTRSTRDFDLLRTWWIMHGESFVQTLTRNPQTAADLEKAEMTADVGESLTRAVAVAAAAEGDSLKAPAEQPWPAVTIPLATLAARYPRAASALTRSQGPLWSAVDLLRHTARPVEAVSDLTAAFRSVADGGDPVQLGAWGSIESRIRPSRQAVDRFGQPANIPASLYVFFRPSKAFAAALAGIGEAPEAVTLQEQLFAAMVDLQEPALRVEVPHCLLLRVYRPEPEGPCQIRSRPAPQLFERANKTAVATDPGAGRRLFAPTPAGAPQRTVDESSGVIDRVLNLFGL
ncbi:MAG: DUF4240 domain-containing protein [Proteobacteria bacterium]|nr:DUF4240 domain-containing protein [Pseudomonadota bacterium]